MLSLLLAPLPVEIQPVKLTYCKTLSAYEGNSEVVVSYQCTILIANI